MNPSGTVKPPSFWREFAISLVATFIVGCVITWAVLPSGVWRW